MSTTTKSLWAATSPETQFEPLKGDISVDVAIVGAGIAGLTSALLLKQAGKRVAVVDMGRVASAETGHTTAHLTEILDTRYQTLISHFGKEGARQAAASHRAAIAQIEAFILAGNISCGFSRLPGYLYTENKDDKQKLEREAEAAREAGVSADLVDGVPLPFGAQSAMRVENQAQFHPREYLLPLADTIQGGGSFVHETTRVMDVQDGEPCRVETDHGRIIAQDVIVATNSPVSNWFFLQTKVASYRTYALAARLTIQRPLPGLFWDMADPYHYIRNHTVRTSGMTKGVEFVVVGGEDHKTGTKENTDECLDRLEAYTRSHFDVADVAYRWSGQILEPVDGLAYIGKNSFSRHVYVATGFSGNGMTYGTLAGMLLSGEILGQPSPWSKLYEATRIKPLASITEFVAENMDFPAYYIEDRLKPSAASIEEVKSGEGRIVKIEGQKYAIYRDENGEVHALNPVCTHMSCLVHWNSAERTWDCPCHGSRFDPDGKLLNGPAIHGLEPAKLPQLHAQGTERHG